LNFSKLSGAMESLLKNLTSTKDCEEKKKFTRYNCAEELMLLKRLTSIQKI
jgi:hypothetical protein